MKKIYIFSLFALFKFSFSFSQCNENDQAKVMLIGDSWAFFMNADGTINDVFDQWGHSDVEYYTNLTLSENGAETIDFLQANKQNEMQNQLLNRPEIEVVHLSLGGNDVLGSWNTNFTQQQTDSLKNNVKDSLIAVIDFIKSVRPDVKILWSGYVYPNFEEVISGALFPSLHPFYGTWQGMNFPDNQTLNTILNDFSSILENHYANDTTVSFVNATGLMQYTFGQDIALEVAPFGTYSAFTAPLPGGFIDYPSPQDAMRNYGVTKDCFHLSVQGYEDFISYHTQKFYHKFFMEDKYFIPANDSKSGSVSNLGNTSNDLLLGSSSGTSYATIINFPTTSNLDYNVEGARLFLRRKNQIGNNPISDSMVVEIKSGGFGTNYTVENIDFSAPSDASTSPCIFGENSDEFWIRLDLPVSFYEFINNYDETQIRLTAPNNPGALVEFYGSDDEDFAPVLDIVYGENSVASIEEMSKKENVITVYPNPAHDMIIIESEGSKIVEFIVYELNGRKVKTSLQSPLNISFLASGTYIIQVVTESSISNHRIIKQ